MSELSGWGRYPRLATSLHAPRDPAALAALLGGAKAAGGLVARGLGRAYGDSAIGPQTVSMRHFDRMIAFDPATGQLIAEAGVSLGEIIAAFLPQGWFPAVTPGTRFVTLGGAIAADVHGKNHHIDGSFSAFVDWIELIGADGQLRRCSRKENAALFGWTCGGMGLTGVILRAAIRLRRVESGWIRQRVVPAPGLGALLEAIEQHADSPYSVAWLDCLAQGAALGRGLLMLGAHAGLDDLPAVRRAAPFAIPRRPELALPFDLPAFVLNRWSLRAFNALYHAQGARHTGERLIDWARYFYPLDAIGQWNRLYGRRGFVQFQCVLPLASGAAGVERLLTRIADTGMGSFLAVLKRFGPQRGAIAFPMEGYTLALDFPASRRALALLDELDRITLDHGGRFYLAKDARLAGDLLRRADPRWAAFAAMRRAEGLAGAFVSAQSQRLEL